VDKPITPLDTRPRSVALVGMGPSISEYLMLCFKKKNLQRYDEVWGINATHDHIRADKTFLMDDLKGVEKRYPEWADRLKLSNNPIITCKEYSDYPAAFAFPIREVMNCVRDDYFTNTVAYAVGYAIYTGVQELSMFGCDFAYPGSAAIEPGHGNVCYLLGIAKERGLNYKIPGGSSLLDCNMAYQDKTTGKVRRPLYGYDFNPGESMARVKAGQATEQDHLFADRAPKLVKIYNPQVAEPAAVTNTPPTKE
jgi:hypothetical protein